ncbi:MAG: hypothetical protein CFE29_27535 [Bradyrhizobiaceae bacterium PARB1]|jgi:Immunity protein 21|nr:MAG: hypothetical protein CFE29_27535 [Bradyrhizobiaceae bacterium PARB1]
MSSEAKWVGSGGGPLICVEERLAHHWLGVDNAIAGDDDGSDYDRACDIGDFLGKVPLPGADALILGDEPLQTCVDRTHPEHPSVLRVYYADPDIDVIRQLHARGDLDFANPEEMIEIDVGSTPLVIFDAAFPGEDRSVQRLSFDLRPGHYKVLTKRFEPDERISVLVHRFVRQEQLI